LDDFLPANPKARRVAIAAWIFAALIGTIAVLWLSSYLKTLAELAQTDREASLALFRTRVLPALALIVLIAVASGAVLLRQGLQIIRSAQFPLDDTALIHPTRRQSGSPARMIGAFFAVAGFLLAAVPLIMISIVLWMLRRA
jgi:hypothetical protein